MLDLDQLELCDDRLRQMVVSIPEPVKPEPQPAMERGCPFHQIHKTEERR